MQEERSRPREEEEEEAKSRFDDGRRAMMGPLAWVLTYSVLMDVWGE